MVLWSPTRKILLALPEELLIDVDEAADQLYMSRSEYIRLVLYKAAHDKARKQKDEMIKEKPWRFSNLNDS
jgi:metal-responsive CopG/Arc/MetJ family transcriptional regulator